MAEKASNGKPTKFGKTRKKTVGCQNQPACGCKCRPCNAGTIVLITCNVDLGTTLKDLTAIVPGRIVRILHEHQLHFVSPEAAKALKRVLEEAAAE